MDRRSFLKRFGIGAAAAVAAPIIVKEVLPLPEPTSVIAGADPIGAWEQMKEENIHPHYARMYPATYDECAAEADFLLHQAMDEDLFLGHEHYETNIDEYIRRQQMRKYWPELVRRYGKRTSITDFINII